MHSYGLKMFRLLGNQIQYSQMVFAKRVGIYQPTPEHQSLPFTLYYIGSDVQSDTSLFRKGLLTDGQ